MGLETNTTSIVHGRIGFLPQWAALRGKLSKVRPLIVPEFTPVDAPEFTPQIAPMLSYLSHLGQCKAEKITWFNIPYMEMYIEIGCSERLFMEGDIFDKGVDNQGIWLLKGGYMVTANLDCNTWSTALFLPK